MRHKWCHVQRALKGCHQLDSHPPGNSASARDSATGKEIFSCTTKYSWLLTVPSPPTPASQFSKITHTCVSSHHLYFSPLFPSPCQIVSILSVLLSSVFLVYSWLRVCLPGLPDWIPLYWTFACIKDCFPLVSASRVLQLSPVFVLGNSDLWSVLVIDPNQIIAIFGAPSAKHL